MQLPTPTGPFRPHEHRPGAEFGDRMLGSIERHEAVQWAERHERKQSVLQAVPKSNKVRVIALTPPANLRFDFYLATKHKCVHYMKVTLNLRTM